MLRRCSSDMVDPLTKPTLSSLNWKTVSASRLNMTECASGLPDAYSVSVRCSSTKRKAHSPA